MEEGDSGYSYFAYRFGLYRYMPLCFLLCFICNCLKISMISILQHVSSVFVVLVAVFHLLVSSVACFLISHKYWVFIRKEKETMKGSESDLNGNILSLFLVPIR